MATTGKIEPTPSVSAQTTSQPLPDVPQGLSVVKLTDQHTYLLDEDALEKILLQDDIKDLPVVVVSVAGAFRGGKSFLLSFFLRYLNASKSDQEESAKWLGVEDKPLTGFSWRGGSARHTTGIVMWSKPFVCTLPSEEKVAVLLMDTQGTFDSHTSLGDCSTIFALSTLLSSVQIYNIANNIKEDDLMHLELFTKYGRMLQHEDDGKAFQELLFLIRDWQYDYEYGYGLAGGAQVLENSLQVREEQSQDMRDLRQHIRSCFEKISCYLMPHPGRNVRKPKFDGRISELDPEFKMALLDLVPTIFASSKLIPKLINGEKVKARDLLTYFKSYMKIFNSGEMPSVLSIVEATSEAAMLSAVREARASYESIMDQKCGPKQPSWPKVALNDVHNSALNEARNKFSNKKDMGSIKKKQAYLAQLTQDLEIRLPEFLIMNENKTRKAIDEGKEKYHAFVLAIHGTNMLCLHPTDLEKLHKDAVAKAEEVFDSNRKQFLNVKDEEKTIFLESFAKELDALRGTNDINNRLVVSDLTTNYSTVMGKLCARDPPLDDNAFLEQHKATLNISLKTLDEKRNLSSDYADDPYKTDLSEKILENYTNLSSINRSKNRKALQQALSFYENYMKAFWDPKTCCLHPADLQAAHNIAKNQALEMISASQDFNIEKVLLAKIMEFQYRDWKDINNSANNSAVTAAYNKYYKGMENDCAPTGWWIFIVPMIVQMSRKSKYHRKNKEEALVVFYNARRDTMNRAYDPYFTELVSKIDRAYSNF